MKRITGQQKQWLAGLALLVVTIGWCFVAGRVIYYHGDSMIGLHPALLLLVPFTACLVGATIGGCILRKWRFAALAAASFFMVYLLFSQGYRIGIAAWTQSIRHYDAINQNAIRQSAELPEMTDNDVKQNLYAEDKLPVLKGFKWYCEHHLASPNGTFRAFRYRGQVHVRIQKIRHGHRGIVFLASPADREKLMKDAQLIYEDDSPINGHWLVWRSF